MPCQVENLSGPIQICDDTFLVSYSKNIW